MDIFTVRDLRERPGEIIRDAEQGHLSLVTKRGHPVFVAVPFQEELLQMGLHKRISLLFLQQGSMTLRQAAKFANLSMEEMMTLCAGLDISLVDYSGNDLKEELKLV